MKRLASALLITAIIAAPAVQAQTVERHGSPSGERPDHPAHSRANPGRVIAAEVAFNQLAQKEGQWTAFLETSAPEAEMFTPQRVRAQTWLKDRPNPPQSVKWQPYEVWSSCDGTYAVTRGAWQQPGGGKSGYFTTLWQRQPKKGNYKWLLDQGVETAEPVAAPEMISGLVADCRTPTPRPEGGALSPEPARRKQKPSDVPMPPSANAAIPGVQAIAVTLQGDRKDGRSRDGTLDWTSVVAPDGARVFVVRMWKDSEMREVLRAVADAQPAAAKP